MTVDRLAEYGLDAMDDGEIGDFLRSQRTGVLGLPGDGTPYLVPMSFGYDGESVYFTYVLGDDSRKATLTDRADRASFLAYSAESPYVWRSVMLSGPVERVPDEERAELGDALAGAWRPDPFETVGEEAGTAVYRLRIESATGYRHAGLPPGFEADPEE